MNVHSLNVKCKYIKMRFMLRKIHLYHKDLHGINIITPELRLRRRKSDLDCALTEVDVL